MEMREPTIPNAAKNLCMKLTIKSADIPATINADKVLKALHAIYGGTLTIVSVRHHLPSLHFSRLKAERRDAILHTLHAITH